MGDTGALGMPEPRLYSLSLHNKLLRNIVALSPFYRCKITCSETMHRHTDSKSQGPNLNTGYSLYA